jgi:hypothetical protein
MRKNEKAAEFDRKKAPRKQVAVAQCLGKKKKMQRKNA